MIRVVRNVVKFLVFAGFVLSGVACNNDTTPPSLEPGARVIDGKGALGDDITYEVNGRPWDGKSDRNGKIWEIIGK